MSNKPGLPKLPRLRLRRLPPQLEVLLQRSLISTGIMVMVFVSFGVAAAILLGRVYDQPLLTVVVLLVAGYFAL